MSCVFVRVCVCDVVCSMTKDLKTNSNRSVQSREGRATSCERRAIMKKWDIASNAIFKKAQIENSLKTPTQPGKRKKNVKIKVLHYFLGNLFSFKKKCEMTRKLTNTDFWDLKNEIHRLQSSMRTYIPPPLSLIFNSKGELISIYYASLAKTDLPDFHLHSATARACIGKAKHDMH